MRFAILVLVCLGSLPLFAAPPFREDPVKSNEWGFRPADGEVVSVTPAPFVWQPQPEATGYELEYARDAQFRLEKTRVGGLTWNAHCPPSIMKSGPWHWRVRAIGPDGRTTAWSTVRRFTVTPDAAANPQPAWPELSARIPAGHPRILLRPERLAEWRELAATIRKEQADEVIKECERLLAEPPGTAEPPLYHEGMQHGGIEWRKMWWGNRLHTLAALEGAATLGFGYQLTGNPAYGELARRILLECAAWDPRGATSRAYNDECAIPYISRFSRAYSFVNDLLTEPERERCRAVIRERGQELFDYLCPDHFYQPYNSHSNRAWHFLGEAGLVFYGEIPEAENWLKFALDVYFCVYPVWGDDDGGWHEGLWYWGEYLERFFYWADVMQHAFDISIYAKPFFSRTGYYAMYLQPPHTNNGGFGDLAELHRGSRSSRVMRALAAQSGNAHWQWYANQLPEKRDVSYLEFIRGGMGSGAGRGTESTGGGPAKTPGDLPTSRLFRGNGLAFLNTDLAEGRNNVQLLFKSSPRGTASHGYDANNSFILNVFGEPLLIHSGIRDQHASNFHKNWMWETKSTNSITAGNRGQSRNSFEARGRITGFATGDIFDYVSGEAGDSYGDFLNSFERQILFCKPGAILIVDRLQAPEALPFEWHLHSPEPMRLSGQTMETSHAGVACRVEFLLPAGLEITVSDRFEPPPQSERQLTQYHLTAATPAAREMLFVTLIRPGRTGQEFGPAARCREEYGTIHITVDDDTHFSVERSTGRIRATAGGAEFDSHDAAL